MRIQLTVHSIYWLLVLDHAHVGEAKPIKQILIHRLNQVFVWSGESGLLSREVHIKVTHITGRFLETTRDYWW